MDLLNTLGINTIELIAYFVNFLIVLYLLNRFIFKKVISNMETREKLAKELVEKNQHAQKSMEEAQKKFDEIISKANNQAMSIVNKADNDAKLVGEDTKEKAQKEAKEILERARIEVENEYIKLKQELEKEFGNQVISTVNQILKNIPESERRSIMQNIDTKIISQ